MTRQVFIDQVHENWRKRLQKVCHAQALEAYCKQVNICIEIALLCMETDRHRRPNIVDIIHKLNETETVIKQLKNDQGHRWTSSQITKEVVAQGTEPDSRSVRDQNPPFKDSVMSDVSANLEGTENEHAAAEDDPLPDIAGLRITGEAFPGRELQACGYPMYGTTGCNYWWVRHFEDGSATFIEGACNSTYLVTADDVDILLAVEVEPLDIRGRKILI